MAEGLAKSIRSLVARSRIGVALHRLVLPDLSDSNLRIWRTVRPFTMTSLERVNALVEAVRYLVANQIEGAFVECGVWRGGSAMAMALTLRECADESRDLYLYDTFSGMTAPSDADKSIYGQRAARSFDRHGRARNSSIRCSSGLDDTRANLSRTGYPEDRLHFVEGPVEETVPGTLPSQIALLRLDTDWYESTRHEMRHMFPRLVSGGVLLVDDYGHWDGARRAVDEFIAETEARILLNRIDYTGRIAVKTS